MPLLAEELPAFAQQLAEHSEHQAKCMQQQRVQTDQVSTQYDTRDLRNHEVVRDATQTATLTRYP